MKVNMFVKVENGRCTLYTEGGNEFTPERLYGSMPSSQIDGQPYRAVLIVDPSPRGQRGSPRRWVRRTMVVEDAQREMFDYYRRLSEQDQEPRTEPNTYAGIDRTGIGRGNDYYHAMWTDIVDTTRERFIDTDFNIFGFANAREPETAPEEPDRQANQPNATENGGRIQQHEPIPPPSPVWIRRIEYSMAEAQASANEHRMEKRLAVIAHTEAENSWLSLHGFQAQGASGYGRVWEQDFSPEPRRPMLGFSATDITASHLLEIARWQPAWRRGFLQEP